MEPLELEFTVDCSPGHAFDVWTSKPSLWWPADHTVSGTTGLDVVFEPRAGGRIFERTPDAFEHDWGEIITWSPPHRLVYLWHLMSDRSDATEVEITFTPVGTSTAVKITHRGWERLGAAAEVRRTANRRGWAGLIPHFQTACQAGRETR